MDESEEDGDNEPTATVIYENPYRAQMDKKRLFLLDFYELMEKCVVLNLADHPRMDTDEAMVECCGENFQIMVHEFEQTMTRVAEMYEDILRHKFGLLGPKYEKEVEEFLHNLKDFIDRDFKIKDSLALSLRGAKVIVNGKLYEDLIAGSVDELADLEAYRSELVRGRDHIISAIRKLLENREEQLEELFKQEEKEAQAALDEEEKRKHAEDLEIQRNESESSETDSDEDNGTAQFHSESSEASEEEEESESEGSGESFKDEVSSETSEIKDPANYADIENNDSSESDQDNNYDDLSSDNKIFDEFKDIGEEHENIERLHDNQIDEEWQNLKDKGELSPNLAYIENKK